MAGLTAVHKLYTCSAAAGTELFDLTVVEGGARIGGRIHTSEFAGDRIEMGATWIHGIGGSPLHKIAEEINSLESKQPWECMDELNDEHFLTVAEGGFKLNPSIVDPICTLFNKLMKFAQSEKISEDKDTVFDCSKLAASINGGIEKLSIGSYLRKGLHSYLGSETDVEEVKGYGNWTRKLLEEAIFRMHENTQRTYTSACDLLTLDYKAESEYRMFPGKEITIAKGYSSIIESLASALPPNMIQLGKKVTKIEWQLQGSSRPVKLHFSDGSILTADHVIITVSLGVLKAGIEENSGFFDPPLPSFKTEAISRLGFGFVNKLFAELDSTQQVESQKFNKFPFLQMVFHPPGSELKNRKIPWWMRRTASVCPIYYNSNVVLSWFAGEEALELETLNDEEIISGISSTVSNFSIHKLWNSNSQGNLNSMGNEFKFTKVLKSQWGTDPLFLGSYSYVAVGSSGEDLDTLAEPLPILNNHGSPRLQILFAGEATHRTHYSTTHGAYFSGIREANRLLQHYNYAGV